jgi:hypothetical protein
MEKLYTMWKWIDLRDYQAHATFMSRVKYYSIRTLRRLGMIVAFITLIAGTAFIYREVNPKTVTAQGIETIVVKTVYAESPIMERIAKCESGGKHYDSTGQVVMRSNTNKSVDVGKFQINSVWFKKATELGFDVTTEKGNTDMAYWIYANRGTQDWYASRDCWAR